VEEPRTELNCTVKVSIGEVKVTVVGFDLADVTRRATKLLKQAAAISVASSLLAEEERPVIGFTAHLERAPDFVDRDLADYFEDSP